MRIAGLLLFLAAVGFLPAQNPTGALASAPFDIVITHGHIIDGTGSPWYSGDIDIRDGHIAAIGVLDRAPRHVSIDAHGMVVAPGFIDMLGQSDLSILVDPRLPSEIYQGITTEITGEGESAAPLTARVNAADHAEYEHFKITPDWATFRRYFARLEHQGLGINLANYVGATSVRRAVLGDADVQPNPAQIDRMQALVRQAMEDGAVGLSTALSMLRCPTPKPMS
jgi:N-acyl-D-amino-acid deacylase